MKRLILLYGIMGCVAIARGQLTTGTNGLTVKAGTAFNCMGLVLTPSADLTIQNDTIRLSNTPVTIAGNASIARVYTISPSISFSGVMGIRYNVSELNGNTESSLSVAYALPAAGFVTQSSTTGATGSYYVSSPGFNNTQLNRVTASLANPLPIRYQDLSATPSQPCSITLSWQADQANAGDFHIERSVDGKTFTSLTGTVAQTGNQFSVVDPAPQADRNIYRLAMIEAGRPVVYSASVTAANPCTTQELAQVYPNPAGASVTVRFNRLPEHNAQIRLLDITGQVIRTFAVSSEINTLHLQDIAAGSYLLQVQNGSLQQSIKMTKL